MAHHSCQRIRFSKRLRVRHAAAVKWWRCACKRSGTKLASCRSFEVVPHLSPFEEQHHFKLAPCLGCKVVPRLQSVNALARSSAKPASCRSCEVVGHLQSDDLLSTNGTFLNSRHLFELASRLQSEHLLVRRSTKAAVVNRCHAFNRQ